MRCLTLAAVALAGAVVAAQDAPVTPAVDAIVIKRNTSNSTSMSSDKRPGGVFVMVNMPATRLIREAYSGLSTQTIGMPEWSERYDVSARMVGNPTLEQQRELWRTLLAERMKLKAHYEQREIPTWDLVLARGDGRLGPNLRKVDIDCEALAKERAAALAAARARGELQSPPPAIHPPGPLPPCESIASRTFVEGTTTMPTLARLLQILGSAGRPVTDRTGLTGSYSLKLEFSPQGTLGTTTPADDRPSLFTAVREPLGLRLEPSRGQAEFLIIDHAERPTEDD